MAKSTWINRFMKLLDNEFENHIIEMWNSRHKEDLEYIKVSSDLSVYVIDNIEESISTVTEVVYDSITRPSKTILCIEDKNILQRNDIKFLISIIEKSGANFFHSLDEAVDFINYENKCRFKISKEVDCILANMEQTYGFR